MLFTTLFQLTALAAFLDPILAQNWTISAYNDGNCEPSEFIFEDNENSTGPEGFGCHTFFNSDLANSVQLTDFLNCLVVAGWLHRCSALPSSLLDLEEMD
ncbi:MAG: hypothetical protein L6R37_006594 [Teloschistes peruensis]|nr:MAG: hypothetical protein L6R37_006594 [Teloschistes peruensis]